MVYEEENCVSREELKNALRRMKKGKAVGPDELPEEVWKCMGEMGIEFNTHPVTMRKALFKTLSMRRV